LQLGADGKYPGEIPKCSEAGSFPQLEYGINLWIHHSRIEGRTLSFRFRFSWGNEDTAGETGESKTPDSYYKTGTMFWLPSSDGIRIWRDYTVFLEVRETGAGLAEPTVMKREFVISFPTPNWSGTFVGRVTSAGWLEGQSVVLQLSQSGEALTGTYRIDGTGWVGTISDTIYRQQTDRTGRFTISDPSRSPSVCTMEMDSSINWSCVLHRAYFGTVQTPCPAMPHYDTLSIQYCR